MNVVIGSGTIVRFADLRPQPVTAPRPALNTPSDRLEGAPNFRSVAALPAVGGLHVKPLTLFRSDALHKLTPADVNRLAALRIGTVLDLRREDERNWAPSRWPAQAQPVIRFFDAAPELEVVQAGGWRHAIERPDFDVAQSRAWMTDTYARMPRALAPAVREALRTLSQPDAANSAMLVHCTAGKDRTGFVCAMVLAALDVPHEAILDDYLESSRRKPPEMLARTLLDYHQIPIETRALGAMIQIAAVREDYLDTALKTTAEQFGSVADYLVHCGLDDARRKALQAALLR